MYLFNKENIWSNPHSCNNNSVDRIISKEEEREDIQGEILQSIFEWCFHIPTRITKIFEYSVFYKNYSVSTRNPSNSAYRINSSTRNTTTTRLIPCHPMQAPSSNCFPWLQAFYTAEQGSYSTPSAPYTSRLPVILGGRNSILHGSQHPRSPYSSSQASSTVLHYRILPGEIGSIPKG